jgi:hypothetical protein
MLVQAVLERLAVVLQTVQLAQPEQLILAAAGRVLTIQQERRGIADPTADQVS